MVPGSYLVRRTGDGAEARDADAPSTRTNSAAESGHVGVRTPFRARRIKRFWRMARRRVYRELDPAASSTLSVSSRAIVALISFSIGISVIGTEPIIRDQWGRELTLIDIAIAVVFAVEYVLRAWCAVKEGLNKGSANGCPALRL